MTTWLTAASLVGALTCDVPAWTRAFADYWRSYPKAEAVDLYKFAHQGILGSEHAVHDTVPVQAWMTREVAGLTTRPEPPPHRAPLIEPLPPDGQFVRVHLRPYLDAKGDVRRLVRAFVATANGPRGDTAQFACAERALAALAPARDVRPVAALFRAQRRTSFDAVHHSPAFEAAYAPAYRVVHRTRIPATK
ncbi:MAG: hypothetical protein IT353_08270 [Gemmatimonadaceae bacterium]|nr:hypothetical protein [Gemmatimonadaceae bacterium]